MSYSDSQPYTARHAMPEVEQHSYGEALGPAIGAALFTGGLLAVNRLAEPLAAGGVDVDNGLNALAGKAGVATVSFPGSGVTLPEDAHSLRTNLTEMHNTLASDQQHLHLLGLGIGVGALAFMAWTTHILVRASGGYRVMLGSIFNRQRPERPLPPATRLLV